MVLSWVKKSFESERNMKYGEKRGRDYGCGLEGKAKEHDSKILNYYYMRRNRNWNFESGEFLCKKDGFNLTI